MREYLVDDDDAEFLENLLELVGKAEHTERT